MRDPVDSGADMAGMISTEYLERCLQKCSLNNVAVEGGGGDFSSSFSSSSSSPSPGNGVIDDQSSSVNGEETTLDLNSHISLPLHWERCLDLKSGEIYYINWRTGKKVWEEDANSNLYYSPSSYDSCSEDSNSTSTGVVSSLSPSSSSTSNSSCFSSRERQCYEGEGSGEYRKIKKKKKMVKSKKKKTSNKKMEMDHEDEEEGGQQVLVVAGCRNCFMYFMVPRLVQDCPKCFTQLLHFDEPSSSSSTS